MHLYVTEQGTRLGKQGGHLVVTRDGEILDDVLISEVESVMLFGSVYPTTDTITALLDNGSEISFLSRGGHFKGRLVPSTGKNVPLRLMQYECFRDPKRAFDIARNCVARKLENGLHVLQGYSNNEHSAFSFEEREQYTKNLQKVQSLSGVDRDALRGYEGLGAKIYFACFARCLADGIVFPGRVYYPSTDPVNALLSFGYTFVSRALEALVESYGMDPMLGFLHEPSYGRSSLALDLLEEFRHPLVDRLVLNLFNRKILTPDDFETRDEEGKAGQVYLKQQAIKTFVCHYEKWMDSPNHIYRDESSIPWRRLLRLRVEQMRRVLLEGDEFKPLEWDETYTECA